MPEKTDRVRCKVTGEYLPVYAHLGDAGADLRAAVDEVIPARGRKAVSTGTRIALPPGYVGLVWPRSGLAFNQGLDCGAGVVDSQYRGEIKVLLFNHTDNDYQVKRGERVAQLLIQKVETVEFVPSDNLDETTRGEGGFGSTGQ